MGNGENLFESILTVPNAATPIACKNVRWSMQGNPNESPNGLQFATCPLNGRWFGPYRTH